MKRVKATKVPARRVFKYADSMLRLARRESFYNNCFDVRMYANFVQDVRKQLYVWENNGLVSSEIIDGMYNHFKLYNDMI